MKYLPFLILILSLSVVSCSSGKSSSTKKSNTTDNVTAPYSPQITNATISSGNLVLSGKNSGGGSVSEYEWNINGIIEYGQNVTVALSGLDLTFSDIEITFSLIADGIIQKSITKTLTLDNTDIFGTMTYSNKKLTITLQNDYFPIHYKIIKKDDPSTEYYPSTLAEDSIIELSQATLGLNGMYDLELWATDYDYATGEETQFEKIASLDEVIIGTYDMPFIPDDGFICSLNTWNPLEDNCYMDLAIDYIDGYLTKIIVTADRGISTVKFNIDGVRKTPSISGGTYTLNFSTGTYVHELYIENTDENIDVTISEIVFTFDN